MPRPSMIAAFGVSLGMAIAVLPEAALAQGAFDMGALTNTLSQDAARRQSQRRAAAGNAPNSMAARTARARVHCANARRSSAAGQSSPKLTQLLSLCNQAGY